MRGIGKLLKSNAAFLAFTQVLTIGEDERLAAIEKIFGQDRVHRSRSTRCVSLARRDRFMFLRGFVEGFEAILKKMSGHVDVEARSAPGNSGRRCSNASSRPWAKASAKIADIQVTIDPALIGGMTLRIGDTLIDGWVATQLGRIQDQLKYSAVNHLQGKLATVLSS